MTHASLSVANAILDEADRQGVPVTPMQLQKLVYFANGWHMEIHAGVPLVTNSFEAWQFGPVMPELYHEFKTYGSKKITGRAINLFSGAAWVAGLMPSQTALLHEIVKIYGRLSGPRMSQLTHKPGTPWSITWNAGVGSGNDIPNDVIVAEFKKLRTPS